MGAPTAVDRQALILNDADFAYDFQNPPAGALTVGAGGTTVKVDRKVFPPLIGTGVAMTVGFIGPCGFNTPHVHPRSSEINIVVSGRLGTEYILENGARPIFNLLDQYHMTVFPKGAMHAEFNPDCDNAVFVAGFADEDPGVQQSAQTLLGFRTDLVDAVLGATNTTIDGKDIDTFRGLVPKNVADGVDSCLTKCGIQRNQKRSFVVL
ncbi:RmlC-like cupin domain-containing protein [Talaromyces proteolyticus]|uniref:RmlC-like cupin domain-containing protein n=1 Tax=Talaromyces proteolyticus TaxID=1131652 RepID=A0AAD4KZC8_9EURO|nr:RmlC-like cupin domain-containing protein [Talaromyces proteolyticus]KAH8703403.1 RmlC-like cupin domain-containing protein [Talaromyces proteolyticus]